MSNQDIFKGFGSNWKWVSVSPKGYARVHAEEPRIENGLLQFNTGKNLTARCKAFDVNVPPVDFVGSVWERTDFTNGPDYETDRFGLVLFGEVYEPPSVETHESTTWQPADTQTSPVDFGAEKVAPGQPEPLRQHDYLTRCPGTSKEVCEAHACGCEPEPVDTVQRANHETSNEMRDLELDAARKPLSDAKARARYLVIEGHLTTLQYVAVFGELPQ